MPEPEWVHIWGAVNGADLLLWGIAVVAWWWARSGS